MSAQTTIEVTEIEEQVVYVDTLGYQYCVQCYHAGIPSRPCVRATPDGVKCDHCERDTNLSVEIITGTAIVEYPMCKIY